jgi:hypothetical protein
MLFYLEPGRRIPLDDFTLSSIASVTGVSINKTNGVTPLSSKLAKKPSA